MLVMGDCENDGRVRREAATLAAHGFDVRVFGMASKSHGPGLSHIGTVTLERLPAASVPQRLLGHLRQLNEGRGQQPPAQPSSLGAVQPHRRGVLWRLALRVHRPTLVLSYNHHAIRAVRRWGPDIVHAHDLPTLPAAAVIAGGTLPLLYDSHELWRHRNRSGQVRPVGRAVEAVIERVLAPRAAVVFTVCDSIARWLHERYRLQRRPVVLRNLPDGEPASSAGDLRSLAGANDERLLLYTGRIMAGRGLELAVSCLTSLPDDVVFVMLGYGDADYVAGLRQLAARCGVSGRVRHIGPVPPAEVVTVAAGADVAYVVIEPVCLSYRYALPNKLFEAIAAGLPVLAADLPEIAQIVHEYGVGAVFRPGDCGSLRRALDSVLTSAPRYRLAADRARETLNWRHEQRLLVEAYESLPSAKRPRPERSTPR